MKSEKIGIIKFFEKDKNFGFIKSDHGELFFRKNDAKGVKLEKNEVVTFKIEQNKKGECAINIKSKNFFIVNEVYKTVKKSYKDKDFIENFSLKFHKYIPSLGDDKTKFAKLMTKFDFNKMRYLLPKNQKETYESCGFEISEQNLKVDSRLAVGLGNPSVYETSMTLHHIYGVPYIPGSALKGVCRNYFVNEISEYCNPKNKKIEKIEEELLAGSYKDNENIQNAYTFIFGTQEKQGKVTFFDSFPVGKISLKADIMTPHYSKYYDGSEPPADYLSPTPIPFLTVENTKFKIMSGIKKKDIEDWQKISCKNDEIGFLNEEKPKKVVKELIKKALTEHGIGAKTAVGYGYFTKKSKG